LKETAFDYSGKKVLGQILSVWNGMALAADESENWSPVNFAKLGQCSLRFRIIAPEVRTRQNDAPACCRELRMAAAVMGGVPFHRRASSHLCGCYASPVISCAAAGYNAERRCTFLKAIEFRILFFFETSLRKIRRTW
jgi:hypothetical protein